MAFSLRLDIDDETMRRLDIIVERHTTENPPARTSRHGMARWLLERAIKAETPEQDKQSSAAAEG